MREQITMIYFKHSALNHFYNQTMNPIYCDPIYQYSYLFIWKYIWTIYFKFSALNSFSRNLMKCSLPAGSFSSSCMENAHRFTRRCDTSFLKHPRTHHVNDSARTFVSLEANYRAQLPPGIRVYTWILTPLCWWVNNAQNVVRVSSV